MLQIVIRSFEFNILQQESSPQPYWPLFQTKNWIKAFISDFYTYLCRYIIAYSQSFPIFYRINVHLLTDLCLPLSHTGNSSSFKYCRNRYDKQYDFKYGVWSRATSLLDLAPEPNRQPGKRVSQIANLTKVEIRKGFSPSSRQGYFRFYPTFYRGSLTN